MSKEYVLWGIPPNMEDETLVLDKVNGEIITSMESAEKYSKQLKDKFGVTKIRIQVIDLSEPFDFVKAIGI